MNALVVIILCLFLLSLWRHLSNQHASVKFRVRLRNLSTDLDHAIASGKIKDTMMARYLSASIEAIIGQYFVITMFSVLVRSFRMPNDKRTRALRKYYRDELKKDKELAHINRRLSYILLYYLKEQHYVSYILFVRPLLLASGGLIKHRYIVSHHIQSFPVSSPITSKRTVLEWK